jgi:hypothetical protein
MPVLARAAASRRERTCSTNPGYCPGSGTSHAQTGLPSTSAIENHLWLITSHIEVTGKDAKEYKAKRAEYDRRVAAAPPVMDVVRDIWSGKLRFAEVTHPDLAVVQDIAVQAGQGRIEDRQSERLGRSDAGIILWRKILTRELRAIAEGRPAKKWQTPSADIVPTLGF